MEGMRKRKSVERLFKQNHRERMAQRRVQVDAVCARFVEIPTKPIAVQGRQSKSKTIHTDGIIKLNVVSTARAVVKVILGLPNSNRPHSYKKKSFTSHHTKVTVK